MALRKEAVRGEALLQAARQRQRTDEFKDTYKLRAAWCTAEAEPLAMGFFIGLLGAIAHHQR
jgi:hypothetical protein